MATFRDRLDVGKGYHVKATIILTCALMITLPPLSWSQDLAAVVVEGGNLEPLGKLVYVDDLLNASREDLRLLRNTVYAKYGYMFHTKELIDHFGKFKWYKATKPNVDSQLSTIDKANLQLIQRIESNYPAEGSYDQKLIGTWYYTPMMPSGEPDKIQFFKNGTFLYTFQGGMELYGSKGFSGIWNLVTGKFTINALTEDVFLYDSVAIGMFGNDYKGSREGKKFVIPEKTDSTSDFKIANKEIIKDQLRRDVIVIFSSNWYKY